MDAVHDQGVGRRMLGRSRVVEIFLPPRELSMKCGGCGPAWLGWWEEGLLQNCVSLETWIGEVLRQCWFLRRQTFIAEVLGQKRRDLGRHASTPFVACPTRMHFRMCKRAVRRLRKLPRA